MSTTTRDLQGGLQALLAASAAGDPVAGCMLLDLLRELGHDDLVASLERIRDRYHRPEHRPDYREAFARLAGCQAADHLQALALYAAYRAVNAATVGPVTVGPLVSRYDLPELVRGLFQRLGFTGLRVEALYGERTVGITQPRRHDHTRWSQAGVVAVDDPAETANRWAYRKLSRIMDRAFPGHTHWVTYYVTGF